jgi:hypothetical protein
MQLANAENLKVCLLLKRNLVKILLILFGFYFFSEFTNAQTNNVGIGTITPDNSSILDLTSTSRGFLAPRMTAAQRAAIVTPATGLTVYQTDVPTGFYFYNGAAWVQLLTGSYWSLTGNAATNPLTNYIGTSDAQPVIFSTNNTERMRILSGGSVGIGTNAPSQLLEIRNGNLLISNGDNTARSIMLAIPNGSGNFYTSFKAQVQAANITYSLPPVVGSAGQVLSALDGLGSLTWSTVSLPVGANGQTLRNNGAGWIANSILFNDGTNIGIGLAMAATQKLEIGGNLLLSNTGTASEMRLAEPSGSGNFYTSFKAQVQAANITYSLPPVVGSAGQVLTALDGVGSLTWTATSLPAGTSGQTLRNNGAGWVANSVLFNDGTNIGIGLAGAASQKLEIGGNLLLSNSGTASELRFAEPSGSGNFYTSFKAQVQAGNVAYTIPAGDGTNGQVLTTNGAGLLSWQTVSGGGSITAVGSMTTGAVFASTAASGQWLGLGAAAGRIAFDNQATNYVNILSANVGIGTTTPGQKLDVYNGNIVLSNNSSAGQLMFAVPNGTLYSSFKAQTQLGNITYTLPANSGTNGQVLTTDGTGLLSWTTVSGGSLPIGTNGQTLRYNGTTLTATSYLFNNGTQVGIGTTTPNTELHLYENTSDNIPTFLIQQDGSGNASLGYSKTATSTSFSVGLNGNDNSNYEISNDATLTTNATYNSTYKMLRIHSEASKQGIVDFNHQSRSRVFLNTANQSIPDATWTKITFNAKEYDEQTEFDVTTLYSFTAKTTGYYHINARAEYNFSGSLNSGAYVSIGIYINGTIHSQGNKLQVEDDGGSKTFSNNNAPVVTDIIFLNAGDVLTIYGFQNTGAAQNIIFGSVFTYLSIHKLS